MLRLEHDGHLGISIVMFNNNATEQQQMSHFVLILIENKYISEYDATSKEIELNVDVNNNKKFVKSNKNECQNFKY